ncbi:protein kinase domain-containing protein [Gemmatimonas sp.]|uniref:protein kinase domain-containing protein n=1 Tax=Gemmatimonas sp. TaxID=1962908 RepID=UPI003983AA4F
MSDIVQRLRTALADRYRLERELGAGGMDTVYLAHDLKHDRDVAIKVLHPDLGAALGGERFLTEIRTTARLQHPHILPLLDSGEADGLLYYVMPLVTGETLRARLERERQLPIADAVRIAREVASALDYAHRQNVIHRDIKPENILLHDGSALVADFGIALAVQSAGGQRMTQTGLSLGTPQYMSPEQAMGERTIDARSDIYALGAVTYEMLTGAPPFTGASVQAIVARVLSSEAEPPSRVRSTIPPNVEQAVLTALAKLPADRHASAAEFATALATVSGAHSSGAMTSRAHGVRTRSTATLLAGAAVLVTATAGATWMLSRPRDTVASSAEVVTRFTIEGKSTYVHQNRLLALSPDGRTLVMWRADANRGEQLFVRQLDQLEMTPIAGSINGFEPTFSPDGRWIAFVVGRQLFKVAVTGGNPIRLTTLPVQPQGITWTSGGEIVYAVQSDSLYAVKETGGAPRALAASPAGAVARWPIALDQSNVVLFAANQRTGDSVRVLALSLADGKITDVGTDAYMALGVARGHLVYLNRTGDLFAAPFDARSLTVTGPGERMGDGVKMNPAGFGLGHAVMSPSGDLVYISESSAGLLTYRDAQGRLSSVLPDTLAYEHPRFSPDARRLVVTIVDSATSRRTLRVLDRSNGFFSPLAGQDPSSGRDRAEWSPDGRSILFRSITDSLRSAMRRPADGSGADTVLLPGRRAVYEVVLAPDEKTLLGRVQNDAVELAQSLLWWTRSDSTLRPLRHVRTDGGTTTGARFSPDGRWIAFGADAPRHVYIAPFPGPGAQVRIDRAGGGTPVWARDGRSLYYYTPTGLVATAVDLSAGVKIGSTRELLGAELANDDNVHAPFDVGPDSTVVFVRQTRFPRVVVVRNFAAEIGRATAGK